MSEIPTKTVPIDSLTPHPENYNRHPESQIAELTESDQSFGQYRNVVVWSPDSEIDLGNGQKLYPDVSYILAGNGYWLGRRRAGRDTIEVKDYTGIPYEDALILMQIDNAAPLGAQPDPYRLKVLLEKTRERAIDRPKLGAMLSKLMEKNLYGRGVNGASPVNDPNAEWVGMPEYSQENAFGAVATIKVHFASEEDIQEFSQLVKQTVTLKSTFIWFPKQEAENLQLYKVQDDEP